MMALGEGVRLGWLSRGMDMCDFFEVSGAVCCEAELGIGAGRYGGGFGEGDVWMSNVLGIEN